MKMANKAESAIARAGSDEGGGIDFVLTWVDGSDPEWRAAQRRWKAATGEAVVGSDPEKDELNGAIRYRDTGLLRYWFRGVERFAPWVRRVFFVTCGQKPAWLDATHPKLRLVSHAEFMPADCLPTFNCRPIHFCLGRIPELSERFVLFDDDMFLLAPVSPTVFFRNGNPVLDASLRPVTGVGDSPWLRVIYNNAYEVNSHFDIARAVWANRRKWFDVFALGPLRAAANFAAWRLNGWMPSKSYGHLAMPHLKSTFEEIWRRCPQTLSKTCRSRFRNPEQVSQWLATTWNLASGRFAPSVPPPRWTARVLDRTNVEAVCEAVRRQAWPQMCLNDTLGTEDSAYCYGRVREAFEELLPTPSRFETADP